MTPLNDFILSGNSSLISIIYTGSSVQVILKGQKSRDKLALCPRLGQVTPIKSRSTQEARGPPDLIQGCLAEIQGS